MDRLRRLRSVPSIQPDTTTRTSDKPPPYTSQNPPVGKNGNAWLSGSKPRSKPDRDQTLDLAKLDSKLEKWAKESRIAEEREHVESQVSERSEKPTGPRPGQTGGARDEMKDNKPSKYTDNKLVPNVQGDSEADKLADRDLESTEKPKDTQKVDGESLSTNEPTDPVADTHPSDFDVFLREAEEEDRLRQVKGNAGRSAKPKREQSLNHFYVSSWADQGNILSSKPKLTEIRESDDPADHQKQHADEDETAAAAAAGALEDDTSSALSTATATSTASSGSHDFADPTTLQQTATVQTVSTQQPRVGRHVSFTEPPTTIITSMRERSASYPVSYGRSSSGRHGQVRFESPRGSRRRKTGIGRFLGGFGR